MNRWPLVPQRELLQFVSGTALSGVRGVRKDLFFGFAWACRSPTLGESPERRLRAQQVEASYMLDGSVEHVALFIQVIASDRPRWFRHFHC